MLINYTKKWSQRKVTWFHCKLFKHETINVIGYKTINIEGKIMVGANFVPSIKIQFTTIQNAKEMLKNLLLKFTLEGQIPSPNGALTDI